jgi:acyl-CoA thioester hydrolase
MVTESVTRLPWQLSKRVLPQHTDHGGVMWHGAYVGWLEEARVEALAAVGLPYRLMALEGLEMPVVRLEMSYKRALLHGDQVVLQSHALAPEGPRWRWQTRLLRADGDCALRGACGVGADPSRRWTAPGLASTTTIGCHRRYSN